MSDAHGAGRRYDLPSDHDLLVILNQRVDLVLTTVTELSRQVDSLEATRDQQLGAYRAGGVSVRLVALLLAGASSISTLMTFLLAQVLRGGLHP